MSNKNKLKTAHDEIGDFWQLQSFMRSSYRHAVRTLRVCEALSAARGHTEAFARNMTASTDSMLEPKKSLRRVMKAKLRQLSAEDMQGESEIMLI